MSTQQYGWDHVAPVPYDSLHWNLDTNHCSIVVYHPPTVVAVALAVVVTFIVNFPRYCGRVNQVARWLTAVFVFCSEYSIL